MVLCFRSWAILVTSLCMICSATQPDLGSASATGFKLPMRRVSRPSHTQGKLFKDDVSLIDVNEFSYLVQMSIGGQMFEVTFDTGSSDLWTVTTTCQTSDCSGVPEYNASQSKTLSVTNVTFQLSYLVGSVLGSVASETVLLGPFQISSQVLGLANSTRGLGLSSTGNSGILGLGFPSLASIADTSGTTVMENIFSSLNESQRFFAFKLGRDLDQAAGESPSSVTFGQFDSAIANDTSGFAFVNVTRVGSEDYNYWKLPFHGMTIDSLSFPISPSLLRGARVPVAVLDTGTTLVLGPTVDVTAFWQSVGSSRKNPATGSWEVRCERGVTVGFILGEEGQEKEYFLDPADISWSGNQNGDWCLGGIQANDAVNAGDWLFGDTFLRNVYVSHHVGTPTQPPFIGLLNVTDSSAALSAFQAIRGTDTSPPPTIQSSTGRSVPRTNRWKTALACGLSSVGGLILGSGLTVLFLLRKRSRCDGQGKRATRN